MKHTYCRDKSSTFFLSRIIHFQNLLVRTWYTAKNKQKTKKTKKKQKTKKNKKQKNKRTARMTFLKSSSRSVSMRSNIRKKRPICGKCLCPRSSRGWSSSRRRLARDACIRILITVSSNIGRRFHRELLAVFRGSWLVLEIWYLGQHARSTRESA